MSQVPLKRSTARTQPPWSPLSVALIALLLPAGGAVLTIRNLVRLGRVEPERVRESTIATVAVFGIGITILLVVGRWKGDNSASPSPYSTWILSCGVSLTSYVMQRTPYRQWRIDNASERPSPWYRSIGTAVIYELITMAMILPVAIVLVATGGTLK